MFVGKTGQELDQHYLPLAGLSRFRIWIGNAISCMPDRTDGKLDPKRQADLDLLNCCASANLYPLLEKHKPKLIVAMGSFACRALDPEINLEFQHGIPVKTKWGIVWPSYHPALGIYEPKKMLMLRTDWDRLRRYLKDDLYLPEDEFGEDVDYSECTTEEEVHEYLFGNYRRNLACDTENRKDGTPYCFTMSHTAGTGRLIRAERADLLEALQENIDLWQAKFLWHNWLHDWKITDAMNLQFPRKKIVDTMIRVFNLGNLPQGLKALAYRELGMQMTDFEDVVKPYSNQLVMQYFRDAQFVDWPKPEDQLVREKDGNWKVKKPHGFNQKVKSFFTSYAKSPEDKDPFAMWEKNWEAEHAMVEEKLGPFPGMCVSHAPFEKVLPYAVRDADCLGRLYPLIQHMASRVRRVDQLRWRDAA